MNKRNFNKLKINSQCKTKCKLKWTNHWLRKCYKSKSNKRSHNFKVLLLHWRITILILKVFRRLSKTTLLKKILHWQMKRNNSNNRKLWTTLICRDNSKKWTQCGNKSFNKKWILKIKHFNRKNSKLSKLTNKKFKLWTKQFWLKLRLILWITQKLMQQQIR